jgi:hypothetical protein
MRSGLQRVLRGRALCAADAHRNSHLDANGNANLDQHVYEDSNEHGNPLGDANPDQHHHPNQHAKRRHGLLSVYSASVWAAHEWALRLELLRRVQRRVCTLRVLCHADADGDQHANGDDHADGDQHADGDDHAERHGNPQAGTE